MMTEMDIETSVYYIHLTRLIAREDFIKFSHHLHFQTGAGAQLAFYPMGSGDFYQRSKVARV
jgi:hypothetical protein